MLKRWRVGEVAEVDVVEAVGGLHVFQAGDWLTGGFDEAFLESVLGTAEPEDEVDRARGALP